MPDKMKLCAFFNDFPVVQRIPSNETVEPELIRKLLEASTREESLLWRDTKCVHRHYIEQSFIYNYMKLFQRKGEPFSLRSKKNPSHRPRSKHFAEWANNNRSRKHRRTAVDAYTVSKRQIWMKAFNREGLSVLRRPWEILQINLGPNIVTSYRSKVCTILMRKPVKWARDRVSLISTLRSQAHSKGIVGKEFRVESYCRETWMIWAESFHKKTWLLPPRESEHSEVNICAGFFR